jgi:hypothetical protein
MAWKFTYFIYRKKICSLLLALGLLNISFAQTIFQPSDTPASPLRNDGQPIEVGIKFRSTQDGYITGIRFYKGAGTDGTHTGQLWSNNGTLLASATFNNETSSGWQQVLFSSPFAITANTTYVGACYNSSGDYANTNSYFDEAVVNGPLRGLADGEDGPNGVYAYSQIATFPSNSFQASNYWVDVVFTSSIGNDSFPPVVASVSPANGAMNINPTASARAIFNEDINPSTINSSTFELRTASNTLVPASITYDNATNSTSLTASAPLANSMTYTATIKGGAQGVHDIVGNALANDYTWSFTVADPPFLPPTEGYGGPILVLSAAGNPFSRYAAEILRAEGLNEFAAKDISTLSQTNLTNYDVIVLGQTQVTPEQVTTLTNWVNAGGTLIAFRPSVLLAPLFGLTSVNTTLADKYLLVNTVSAPGTGIVNETIQFHGEADLYTLNGASSIATLYSDASTATTYPAITRINVGSGGGKAIAFTYDLAKSIIYTRQGNPAWAGQKRDGQTGPVRSDDMFFPGWIDFNKIAIPQADEQQRLFANIILQSNLHRKPLPRLWYLPKGLKAAIVMTGDDHANNGTTGRFNQYLSLGPNTPQDVADWNAIRATSFIYNNTPITNAQAMAFEQQGFEIAAHPTTECSDFTASSLESAFASQLGTFAFNFPSLSKPVSNRTHCMPWSDWATHPKTEFNHGIRMDVNYYYWPATWVQNRAGMFTGSGMPMRFADTDGTLIDCYQATTQMTDESGINVGAFCNSVLDKATGPEGYYGTFVANMHTDTANHTGSNAIIASAIAHKVPVISAKQLLNWTDGRNNSSFGSITWNNNQLSFTLTVPSGGRNLNIMLPFYSETGQLISVTKDGNPVSFSTSIIKGIEYAFINVTIGNNNIVADYSSSPAVTEQPVSQTICSGNSVSFTSAAEADPAPSVQWQVSTNGTNWTNINGATNSTLVFTTAITDNNKQYRAVWTNNNGILNSNPATLTVNPTPSLTSTQAPPAVNSGTSFTYTPASNVNGTTFTWRREAIAGISNPFANGTGSINEILVNTTTSPINVSYTYTLTANGCNNVQHVVVSVNPPPTGCTMSTSITANFNGTSISSGRYIWFSSLFKPANISNRTVNFYVTNGKITYTLNNQLVTLNVPNAHIRVSPSVTTATTQFVNNVWETQVPANYTGNIFQSGLSYFVPATIPGGRNVTWSADIQMDQPNVSLGWKWTAGVYANFSGNAGLNVKPIDGLLNILNPLLGIASAGTPQNYSLSIVAGAMGAGLLNITSTYSSTANVVCASMARSADMVQSQSSSSSSMRQLSSPVIEQTTTNEKFGVKIMPNPGVDYFNLIINSDTKTPVSIRIRDISGRVIEKYEGIAPGSTLHLGHAWIGGSYFAEVIQGDQRTVVKMIKVN